MIIIIMFFFKCISHFFIIIGIPILFIITLHYYVYICIFYHTSIIQIIILKYVIIMIFVFKISSLGLF
jgi:hypothetical protein